MTRRDREQYELHLAQVAFEADRAHMAALGLGRTSPQQQLDWAYHLAARTPLVARYRAIARAVEEALDADVRSVCVCGRRRHVAHSAPARASAPPEQHPPEGDC